MTILESIYKRKSRRSYLPNPIESDKVSILGKKLEKYNAESGLSMRFIEDASNAFNGLRKSYGMFKNVRSIIVLKGNRSDIHLKEKAGYYGELIVLEATKLGLGTCWVGATFNKKDPIFNTRENEALVCVITIGNVAIEATAKENFIRRMAHPNKRSLEYFYNSDSAPPRWFIEGIKTVQLAPSANNKQAYRLEYKNDKVIIKIEEKSIYDLIDLGIAKAHFEIAANGKFGWGNPAVFTKE